MPLRLSGKAGTGAVGNTAVVGHMTRQGGMLKKLVCSSAEADNPRRSPHSVAEGKPRPGSEEDCFVHRLTGDSRRYMHMVLWRILTGCWWTSEQD